MDTVEISTEIHRPVEVVFAYAGDFRNIPQWQKSIQEASVTPDGLPAVGTKGRQVGSFLGVKVEATSEITASEPNRSFAEKSQSGPFPIENRTTFERVAGGTRVNFTTVAEPGGFFKLPEQRGRLGFVDHPPLSRSLTVTRIRVRFLWTRTDLAERCNIPCLLNKTRPSSAASLKRASIRTNRVFLTR
jgi:hypothetical protein